MARGTCLEIDRKKITENSRRVLELCSSQGVEVLGVTKGFSAVPAIVEAIVSGGIESLADARLENVIRLREHGLHQYMTLLRIPMLSQVKKVVNFCQCSLNSELTVMKALSEAALACGKVHDVVLMIDVGDMREGVFPGDAAKIARQILTLKGIHLCGVGTNMGCYGGILPTKHNLNLLCEVAKELENIAGYPFSVVSGGGTSSLLLLERREMPEGVNQLRVGEGILLGTDTTNNRDIPWLCQDAFVLKAEIVEIKSKPTVPYGERGYDAFGGTTEFVDNGIRKRAIVALGRQDVSLTGVTPFDPKIQVLGASSDHMILDIEDMDQELRLGDQIPLKLNYRGLLRACTSRYIKQVFL